MGIRDGAGGAHEPGNRGRADRSCAQDGPLCCHRCLETGMYEYDLNLVYISISSAQRLLNMKGVEGIQIKPQIFSKPTVLLPISVITLGDILTGQWTG